MPLQKPMKNKAATLWMATVILTIGLIIVGLLVIQDPMLSSSRGLQDGVNDPDLWEAASISKETLLLLLAIGIAGVLGLSRKSKGIKKGTQQSKLDDPPDT